MDLARLAVSACLGRHFQFHHLQPLRGRVLFNVRGTCQRRARRGRWAVCLPSAWPVTLLWWCWLLHQKTEANKAAYQDLVFHRLLASGQGVRGEKVSSNCVRVVTAGVVVVERSCCLLHLPAVAACHVSVCAWWRTAFRAAPSLGARLRRVCAARVPPCERTHGRCEASAHQRARPHGGGLMGRCEAGDAAAVPPSRGSGAQRSC
jgi:hypothetical protein